MKDVTNDTGIILMFWYTVIIQTVRYMLLGFRGCSRLEYLKNQMPRLRKAHRPTNQRNWLEVNRDSYTPLGVTGQQVSQEEQLPSSERRLIKTCPEKRHGTAKNPQLGRINQYFMRRDSLLGLSVR